MPADGAKSQSALGFLTVLEHAQHGLMGGYLVLNHAGRPLEFHCTAPIKPNRAQQILYGPTLEPFLYGDQIGQALVAKSAIEPLLICTDMRPAMAMRPLVEAPVALVLTETDSSTTECTKTSSTAESAEEGQLIAPRRRLDSAHTAGPLLQVFQVGRNRLAVTPDRESDRSEILKRLGRFDDLFDLAEPFGRIREALEEAQRGGR